MTRAMGIVMVAALIGCGEEEAPSCQQAVSHYYGAGCALIDPTDGSKYGEAQIFTECKALLANAPGSCVDELEDLRSCWGGVRSPASSNADCDCSSEQDALLTCE